MPSRIAANTTLNTSRELVSCFPPCWLGFLYSAKRLPVTFNFRTAFQRKRFHHQAMPKGNAEFSAVSIVPRRFLGFDVPGRFAQMRVYLSYPFLSLTCRQRGAAKGTAP
jgi:hypothetical protein